MYLAESACSWYLKPVMFLFIVAKLIAYKSTYMYIKNINEDYTHTHYFTWNDFISSYKACVKSTDGFILNLMYIYEVKKITDMINRQTTTAHIRDVTLERFSGFSFGFWQASPAG